jgi:NAD(P)-dependent dehydrogenase (short-subunit alcohol dehydrogenase family)
MTPQPQTSDPETGLKKKRVIVLGGSSGIGLEVARQSFAKGAEVVIASSNAARVREVVRSIGGERKA